MRNKRVTSEDNGTRQICPRDFNLNCRGYRQYTTSVGSQLFAISRFAFDIRERLPLDVEVYDIGGARTLPSMAGVGHSA